VGCGGLEGLVGNAVTSLRRVPEGRRSWPFSTLLSPNAGALRVLMGMGRGGQLFAGAAPRC
jgi:hypothetical protein